MLLRPDLPNRSSGLISPRSNLKQSNFFLETDVRQFFFYDLNLANHILLQVLLKRKAQLALHVVVGVDALEGGGGVAEDGDEGGLRTNQGSGVVVGEWQN